MHLVALPLPNPIAPAIPLDHWENAGGFCWDGNLNNQPHIHLKKVSIVYIRLLGWVNSTGAGNSAAKQLHSLQVTSPTAS